MAAEESAGTTIDVFLESFLVNPGHAPILPPGTWPGEALETWEKKQGKNTRENRNTTSENRVTPAISRSDVMLAQGEGDPMKWSFPLMNF